MKKYKIVLLIVILLSLTGCSFEYNMKIDTNTISEENIVYIPNTDKNDIKQEVEKLVSRYTGPTNSLGMYKQSVIEDNNNFGMSYKKNYDTLNDYNNSLSFSILPISNNLCNVLASSPVISVILFAARPVGAHKTTFLPCNL